MRKMLGISGLFGLLCIVGGIALVADANLQVAAGIAIVLAGLGFLVRAMIKGVMGMMGMGGMM
ncbi:hypothetical protein G9C85_18105 [Halorubellus sp. JP-L1]|nr:hypothetical protein [Halorubellus sp. JP-L1]